MIRLGSPAGTGTITNNGATAATYSIFTSTGNTTFSGTLSDGTATLALTKTGAGATTLAGTNTATGLILPDSRTPLLWMPAPCSPLRKPSMTMRVA